MAFTGQTPESLLDRSDSKNPATTCKGITKLGRPCRNPLDLEAIRNASGDNGVLAVTSVVGDSDEEEIGAAAFFCWRHKDQAEQLVNANASGSGPQRQDTQLFPLRNRSSIDTLVARLGVLEVNDSGPQTQAERRRRREERRQEGGGSSNRPPRRVNRPPTWDRVQGPLISVPSDVMKQQHLGTNRPQKKEKQSFWSSLCCGSADDDYVEVVRHKKRVSQQQYPSEKPVQEPPRVQQPQNGRASNSRLPANTTPPRKPLSDKPARPMNKKRPSETSTLLSYIPKSLPPQTASALLAELSKPISLHDDPGYIYIFWLTEESLGPAPSTTASSLLAPPARPEQARRTSDVLRQYSVRSPGRPNRPRRRSNVNATNNSDDTDEKKTILLKIGRANNVHRRMNEWTRQCGYSLSLVRFYPYVSSTPQPSPAPSPHASPAQSRRPSTQAPTGSSNPTLDTRPPNPHRGSSGVRKVPHAHRVERLIHLELGEKRVMKQCEACGKEHREWFEVEASREGVKGVDEVVRRWVDWAEKAGGDSR